MHDKFRSEELKTFEEKYKERIKKEFNDYRKDETQVKTESRQYQEFKKQWAPKKLNLY